jgi:single-strand DNA-binding protein
MALGLNSLLLIGTLVREPDLRYTPKGDAVLRLDLGGDEHARDEDGAPRTRPWYQRATVFGAQAERVADHLRVGTPVWLEGHLEQARWTDDDGRTRSRLDVIGTRIERVDVGGRDPEDPVAFDARDQPRLRDAVNHVRVLGNLARDADLTRPSDGPERVALVVAVQDRAPRGGEAPVHYVDVRAWRDVALAAGELAKGDAAFVEGRLVNDAWTDASGEKRYATRVEAVRIETVQRLPRSAMPDVAVPPDATAGETPASA